MAPGRNSPPLSATDTTQPAELALEYKLVTNGCISNDVDEVKEGIKEANSTEEYKDEDFLPWSLRRAVFYGAPDVVRYLLEEEGVALDSITPRRVGPFPSIEVLRVLIDHDWDINRSEPDRGTGPGQRLLQLVCKYESIVRWCLDHGASPKDPHPHPYRSPPVLEIAASVGTASTFKLLHSRGAELTPRVLHCAVESAYKCRPENRLARMAMVKYLVLELGFNVNALDSEEERFNDWGTPLCYAAQVNGDNVEVVRFLLEQGADPYIKDQWGMRDAFGVAERSKNVRFSELLRGWEKKQETPKAKKKR